MVMVATLVEATLFSALGGLNREVLGVIAKGKTFAFLGHRAETRWEKQRTACKVS